MIQSVVDFGDRVGPAKLMTPRIDVVAFGRHATSFDEAGEDLQRIEVLAHFRSTTRASTKITGIVSRQRSVRGHRESRAEAGHWIFARPPYFVSEKTKKVSETAPRVSERAHSGLPSSSMSMAANRRASSTIEDVVEEIVGENRGRARGKKKRRSSTWAAASTWSAASWRVEALEELLDAGLESDDYENDRRADFHFDRPACRRPAPW